MSRPALSTPHLKHAGLFIDASFARDGSVEYYTVARGRGRFYSPDAAHFAEEDRPIENVWDATVGITAYAKGIKHQDERIAFERTAGKLLASAR